MKFSFPPPLDCSKTAPFWISQKNISQYGLKQEEPRPLAEFLLNWMDGFHSELKMSLRNKIALDPLFHCGTDDALEMIPYEKRAQPFLSHYTSEIPEYFKNNWTSLPLSHFLAQANGFASKLFLRRELTVHRARAYLSIPKITELFTANDTDKGLAQGDVANLFDCAVNVKMAVHGLLFWGALTLLGSKDQKDIFITKHRINTLETGGGFAMTEMGHGSNVRCVETTAHYDHLTDEFVIHTPSPSAKKVYIGNAASHGQFFATFAQLIIQEKTSDGQVRWVCHGPHCFVVKCRDKNLKVCEGITIDDHGPKLGLNGIDNGAIQFTHYRIPGSSLLRKFAQVVPPSSPGQLGKYISIISNANKRFTTMITALTRTRLGLISGGNGYLKQCLTCAIHWAKNRKQFGPSIRTQLEKNDWSPLSPIVESDPIVDSETENRIPITTPVREFSILEYTSTQDRLFPYIAQVFILDNASKILVNKWKQHTIRKGKFGINKNIPDSLLIQEKALISLIGGFKSYSSWGALHGSLLCRAVMGGFGYIDSASPVSRILRDIEIFQTFEGSNIVLLQQVVKDMLSTFSSNVLKVPRLKRGQKLTSNQQLGIAYNLTMASLSASGHWPFGNEFGALKWTSSSPSQVTDVHWISKLLKYRSFYLLNNLAKTIFSETKKKTPVNLSALELEAVRHSSRSKEEYARNLKLAKKKLAQKQVENANTFRQLGENNPFQVWNKLLPQICELAMAHVESTLFDFYLVSVFANKSPVHPPLEKLGKDPETVKKGISLLKNLGFFWGLCTLRKARDWFLAHKVMSIAQSSALDFHIFHVRQSIYPNIIDIVDSFAIPYFWQLEMVSYFDNLPTNRQPSQDDSIQKSPSGPPPKPTRPEYSWMNNFASL